ncbi:hypothetical protein ACHAXT_004945 [Thalassiosira profunda]
MAPRSRPAALALALLHLCMLLGSASAFSPPPSQLTSARSTTSLSATAAAAVGAPPITPPPSYALFGLTLARAMKKAKPLFSIPSIFTPSDARPVVLFDGKCNLCNAGVQLVLDMDRASDDPRGNLRVAALQSRVGKVLLARLPEAQRETVLNLGGGDQEYKSIVVAGKDKTWLNSDACLKIGRELRGPLRYLALLASIIPSFIRDPIYKFLSKFRKRLFGEAPECRLWDDNWDTRFVDDALFGGRSGEVDPFADPNAVQEEAPDDDEEDTEEAPPGAPPLNVGDAVRVASSTPIVHTHVAGYEAAGGLCSVGMVGTVTRVLERRAYPKNVAVRFEFEEEEAAEGDEGGKTTTKSFEAHFFPGSLKKE